MKIAVLTSSRADYGVYRPLLKALNNAEDIDWGLIVFGTHLSKFHGYTVIEIENDGYPIKKRIESLLLGDTPNAIANSYALTAAKFADYWGEGDSNFDLVFVLGDRFEMAAGVVSGIPYGVKFAHIHGGETTQGAIDNIYRHSISLASSIHFVSATPFEQRLLHMLGDTETQIYNVGSLSLENLEQIDLLDLPTFKEKWGIDLEIPTILVTVHPETVEFKKNEEYCCEIIRALQVLASTCQIVVTMPNADTFGSIYRTAFLSLAKEKLNIYIIENFGTQSYFTCMKYTCLLIGNTSSGIIEAASFKKYVLNIGDRQKGRLTGDNVIHLPFDSKIIINNALRYAKMPFEGKNLYFKETPSINILNNCRNFIATH
jgi:GDP/UDP-N,N'-diacetylbacillosamine 2-epimerase (hydrolysing)